MSVIIRLQNLPWSANALDIRQFFSGLSIPEGGVHIVGGELGDAFIAFSTDEDARQAFNLNGGKIKEVQIKLLLSSRIEMQKVIEAARNPLAAFMQRATPAVLPAAVPAVVPEINKNDKEKRDRRRSRSRSRDRKDRSRDSRERDRRDRRRRDRSRSRSRDRKERRRRDRSRSKDRHSRDSDRYSKEKKERSTSPNVSNKLSASKIQNDPPKPVVWSNNVPVVQTPTIFNTLLPAQLQQSTFLLNYRNGLLQNQQDSLNISRMVNTWNLTKQVESHTFQDDLKAVSNIIGNSIRNSVENNSQSNANRSARVSRFDIPPEKSSLSPFPPRTRGPHPLDRLDGNDIQERPNYDRFNDRDRYDRDRPILKNCCIELLPFFGGYGEIRKFFNGLFIHNNGIKFLNDEFGKRTGEVYIRFASPTGKERALNKNGTVLRDSKVELNEISDDVFENAIDRYQPHRQRDFKQDNDDSNTSSDLLSDCTCLAIDDLPFLTKEQDILKIFANYSLQQILLEPNQRHVTAYIKFSTSTDAHKAAKDQATVYLDGSSFKVRLCSDEEYQTVCRDEDPIIELNDDETETPSIETDCVSLSGLPKKTTNRDVTDFFSDVAIVPNKIHLISSNFGFIGQAYCEFPTMQDAKTALQKNGMPLGYGIVKVIQILRSEMEANIGQAIPRDPVAKPLSNPSVSQLISKNIDRSVGFKNFEKNREPKNAGIARDEKRDRLEQTEDKNYKIPNDNTSLEIANDNGSYEPSDLDNNFEKSLDNGGFAKPNESLGFDMQAGNRRYDLPNEHRFEKPPTNTVFERPNNTVAFESSNANIHFEAPNDNVSLEKPNDSMGELLNDNQGYDVEQDNQRFEMLQNNRISQDNQEFKLGEDTGEFEMEECDQSYEMPIDDPSLEMSGFADQPGPYMRENNRRFGMSNIDRNYEFAEDSSHFDSPNNDENFEMPDRRDAFFERFALGRNYSMAPKIRNFESPPFNARRFGNMPGSRHFAPTSNNRIEVERFANSTNAQRLSRLPPPLMGIARLPPRHAPPADNPSEIGGPGCTILMENVPFKAGLDEILEFFEGFAILEDNVLRRYTDNGLPSGEAKVIFNSKDEAYQALQKRNLQKIRERTIYLTQM